MPNKMLIDASHPEETRVVVTRGNRIEEFDFESQDKKQLKGNIYLARVTRVEPSLQAAFVEYGGNRHGFLAFSEIHPDYYQIPMADRQALLRAEAEAHEDEDDDEDGDGESRQERGGRGRGRRRRGRHRDRKEQSAAEASDEAKAAGGDDDAGEESEAGDDAREATAERADGEHDVEASASDEAVLAPLSDETVGEEVAGEADAESDEADDDHEDNRGGSMAAAVDADVISEAVERSTEAGGENGGTAEETTEAGSESDSGRGTVEEAPAGSGEGEVESVGAEDALEEIRERRRPMRRHYKIQEVIKRRQILLVQVVKEERGNKGAALTTYLSLAGRYSVLMPNTARGGGISRKITNATDRKRLKDVVKDLDVPQGMGVILRTAGESRTKAEIKRDYEYLMRMWETVRNTTLQSTAPALVYEEGSLIKRSVRDLYNKDIDEILVAGEDGYREAKDFMRMLMPSHAKVVQPYRDTVPIFARSGIEGQLDKMLQPQVTLKSGGYIIINQTEALVSIDVNSGRSTREHSIEDTALQTNLEAAEEVSRQLRLRDLAGLIVIDFIDMEENRNNRAVEKKLKDCLKNDRARIQVGRISHFGLLEMSRQRIRASVLESTMKPCPHCGGTGHVRSDSSVALHVVRAIEEFLLKDSRSHITVKTPVATALYVLNHKRAKLSELEARFGVTITVEADDTVGAQHYQIFRGAIAEKPADFVPVVSAPAPVEEPDEPEVEIADEDEAEDQQPERQQQRHDGEDGEHHRDRKRRRRRRRGGRDREHRPEGEQPHVSAEAAEGTHSEAANDDEGDEDAGEQAAAPQAGGDDRKKRRRGKRGGKRNRSREGDDAETQVNGTADGAHEAEAGADDEATDTHSANGDDREPPAQAIVAEVETVSEEIRAAEPAEEPARTSRRRASSETPSEPVVSSSSTAPEADKPKKGGWWQRKGFF